MIGHYKRSKFLAEEAVRALVRDEGVPAVIVNPSAPIGPRDIKPTPTGRIIVDFATGRMPAYVDTGLNVVHVDDCAAGHLQALEQGAIGERYILGGDDMTLREILECLARLTGRPAPRIRLNHRMLAPVAVAGEAWARVVGGEPRLTRDSLRMARKMMFFSSAKAVRELGYTVPGQRRKRWPTRSTGSARTATCKPPRRDAGRDSGEISGLEPAPSPSSATQRQTPKPTG